MGPKTGIQAYPQSDPPLPEIGKSEWKSRGAKSLAGLMANPVGPPKDNPIDQTKSPTRTGPNPWAKPESGMRFFGEDIAKTPNTKTKVAMISQKKLAQAFRTAGAVQKTARLASGSWVNSQCE